jgi:hypothetical protein
MGELEVEAAIAHVLRRAQILGLLLKKSLGQCFPLRALLLVTPDVVQLRAWVEQAKVETCDNDEGPVAIPVCNIISLCDAHRAR